MAATCIVWLRSDLRLADNPALSAAAGREGCVLPVFIFSPEDHGEWAPGAASRAWLHQSLTNLDRELKKCGAKLLILKGDSFGTLAQLIEQTRANGVFWNREYSPTAVARDSKIKSALKAKGIEVKSFKAGLLFEPQEVENKSGRPFRVFTPFYKHVLTLVSPQQTLPAPARLRPPKSAPKGVAVEALGLMPDHPWAGTMLGHWRPGAGGAAAELEVFAESAAEHYPEARDRPGAGGVSRLSPHLHFGELSPRQVWNELSRQAAESGNARLRKGTEAYLRQIVWREFAHHLLFHFPKTPTEPFDPKFQGFPWKANDSGLRAWRRGQTGYPMVDAGMRELWATGWMHNRTRMVVASFLTKHLLVHWHAGARWFWDTLVDADLANNTMGWQWTAGCGADAAPYFRIFNPVTQGERFDADGRYVRRWIPELARLPDRWLQRPWTAPQSALEEAGVRLG